MNLTPLKNEPNTTATAVAQEYKNKCNFSPNQTCSGVVFVVLLYPLALAIGLSVGRTTISFGVDRSETFSETKRRKPPLHYTKKRNPLGPTVNLSTTTKNSQWGYTGASTLTTPENSRGEKKTRETD